jgi:hypothetical protein
MKQTRQTLARYLRKNNKMPYPIKDVSQQSTRSTGIITTTLNNLYQREVIDPERAHRSHPYLPRCSSFGAIDAFRSRTPAVAVVVLQMTQVDAAADTIVSDRITPVFAISSVTGNGMDLLRYSRSSDPTAVMMMMHDLG